MPNYNQPIQFSSNLTADKPASISVESKKFTFENPVLSRFESGCAAGNLNSEKFGDGISISDRAELCEAIQQIANGLNNTNWSPALRRELRDIWTVFLSQNVKIYPMKKGVSSRIAASAEAFLPNSREKGFIASLYLRPRSAKDNSFNIAAIHEIRHVYDFYTIWKDHTGITKAELEKRGFRIMGKIAKETPQNETFSRLPKLWDDAWRSLSEDSVREKVESRIIDYMSDSKFYRDLIANPNDHFVGYRSLGSAAAKIKAASMNSGKSGRLPYIVKTRQTREEIEQNVEEIPFELEKARDAGDPAELLKAALKNEKALYYKMDNFVYDQDLDLKCWKKEKVVESYLRFSRIARDRSGKPLFDNEKVTLLAKSKGASEPSCLRDMNSIKTDATETFWSAPYLDEMPIKFVHFTELDGVKVARYTVYKPAQAKFDEMAAKYPFINPFRVFFGTIFVSVEDSQIVKFWGSSYPEAETTGQSSPTTMASYNATAIRQKLESGIWVTTKLNTVAVAEIKGKMKPFSYTVDYKNYRQATSDVLILDDEDIVAALDR
ncbi:MAG: hypothetical protein KDB79_03595 [Acidobacteria bacterium]|nr:hypothetical protein [Acidobacteriota bacterium]